jgi:hypothetical protein
MQKNVCNVCAGNIIDFKTLAEKVVKISSENLETVIEIGAENIVEIIHCF